MPKISVIVPVYKVEKYINRCVDSILGQTFTDFELILVDDGSPDSSGVICDEYASKDSRVIVIHQSNGGLSAARNAGIDWAFANSDSEWLSFVDSDDWVHPRYLEALYNAVTQTKLNIAICGFERTDGDNPIVDEDWLQAIVCNTEKFYIDKRLNSTVAWGKLYRKSYLKEIRYPIGKLHEDEFVTYRILFEFETLAVIDQPLYAYYQNDNGIMRSEWNPKRFAKWDALGEQIDYFNKRGFYNIANINIRVLYLVSCDVIKKICGITDKRNDEYLDLYISRLRYFCRKYKKSLYTLFGKSERFSIYCLCSGNRFLINWVIKSDFEPLQKLLIKIKRKDK